MLHPRTLLPIHIFFSFDLLTVEVNWESCSQNSCFSEKIIKNNCHVALPYYLKQVWLFMSGIRENMYHRGSFYSFTRAASEYHDLKRIIFPSYRLWNWEYVVLNYTKLILRIYKEQMRD